jgi:threonyl-tRNA synthetase
VGRAEGALKAALDATGRRTSSRKATARSIGPKIDFDVLDSLGRAWQLGTIQLDYSNPERFRPHLHGRGQRGASAGDHPPAVSGSFERFMAILIEHFAGAFPTWLAPEQVRVIPITDDQAPVAEAVTKRMRAAGDSGACGREVGDAQVQDRRGRRMKVPYLAVIGKREAEADLVAINVRGAGKEQKPAPVAVV